MYTLFLISFAVNTFSESVVKRDGPILEVLSSDYQLDNYLPVDDEEDFGSVNADVDVDGTKEFTHFELVSDYLSIWFNEIDHIGEIESFQAFSEKISLANFLVPANYMDSMAAGYAVSKWLIESGNAGCPFEALSETCIPRLEDERIMTFQMLATRCTVLWDFYRLLTFDMYEGNLSNLVPISAAFALISIRNNDSLVAKLLSTLKIKEDVACEHIVPETIEEAIQMLSTDIEYESESDWETIDDDEEEGETLTEIQPLLRGSRSF